MIKIPIEIIDHLHSVNLIRSQALQEKYLAIWQIQKELFVKEILQELETKDTFLVENSYPYDIFCKDKLEHFILFGTTAFFHQWNWEQLVKVQYPGFDFYFQNSKRNQSVKEVQHIHLFKKV